jgi:arylformamidase
MKWIDITLPMSAEYPPWPGLMPFSIGSHTKMEDGEVYNATHLKMNSHFGTHIDAPRHFLSDGGPIDELSLDYLIGPCQVFELACPQAIGKKDLEGLNLGGVERVLFKTNNKKILHDNKFHQDYVGIDASGARYLVERRIKVVGVDYYSVALWQEAAEVHQILLKKKVVLLEAVDLTHVGEGHYHLIALPMKVKGAEAAPARIVLGKE